MISEKKMDKIIRETYTLLYKYAYPSADFNSLCENCCTYRDRNNDDKLITLDKPLSINECKLRNYTKDLQYDRFFLPHEVMVNIIENQKKLYKIPSWQAKQFDWCMYLGAGPTSGYNSWKIYHPGVSLTDLQQIVDNTDYGEYKPEKQIIVK
jgi:hypothetical protein